MCLSLSLGDIASKATPYISGMTKVCSDCCVEKPLDGFAVQRSNRDGKRAYCKPCGVARTTKWQRENPGHKNANGLAYFFRHHEERLAAGRKWKREHRAQEREYQKKYRSDHPDTTSRLWRKRWRERHPDLVAKYKVLSEHRRRARKMGVLAAATQAQLDARWDLWGGRCWICHNAATEWDHVKPLSRGGAHIPANMRPCCGPCNRHKRNDWPFTKEHLCPSSV